MPKLLPRTLFALAALACTAPTAPAEEPFRLDLELGAAWQSRNDFAIPPEGGTLVRLGDDGPFAAGRAALVWHGGERWSLRLLAAPLAIDSELVPESEVHFQGVAFPAGVPLVADYAFNSYRLTWFHRFAARGHWALRAGATLNVRDAEIALSGSGVSAAKDDLGVVPLLYGAARWSPNPRFAVELEADALAASQGRAIDASLRGELSVSERTRVYAGYRVLDGGADNDEVLTFATFHFVVAGLSVSF